jgi:hypothetical protein
MNDIQSIKEALEALPAKYASLSQEVIKWEREYEKAKALFDLEKAKVTLEKKARDKEAKEAEVKAYVETITNPSRLKCIEAEADFKAKEAELSALDKEIQLLRNRCELFICETYSTNSISHVENIRDRKVF